MTVGDGRCSDARQTHESEAQGGRGLNSGRRERRAATCSRAGRDRHRRRGGDGGRSRPHVVRAGAESAPIAAEDADAAKPHVLGKMTEVRDARFAGASMAAVGDAEEEDATGS